MKNKENICFVISRSEADFLQHLLCNYILQFTTPEKIKGVEDLAFKFRITKERDEAGVEFLVVSHFKNNKTMLLRLIMEKKGKKVK